MTPYRKGYLDGFKGRIRKIQGLTRKAQRKYNSGYLKGNLRELEKFLDSILGGA